MVKIGKVELGSMPHIALAVGEYSDQLIDTYRNGVSVLEIRIDLFSRIDFPFVKSQLEEFKKVGLPLLATIRTDSEKGKWKGTEEEREKLFISIVHLVDAIDIELDSKINKSIASCCKKAGKTLIVSNHDFEQTPDNNSLKEQLEKAKELGADIVKLACLAKNQDDVTRLLSFIKDNKDKGVIGISMGAVGSISRVMAPLFGSLLTYTSTELNYGQLSLRQLIDMYKVLYPAFNEKLIITRDTMEFI